MQKLNVTIQSPSDLNNNEKHSSSYSSYHSQPNSPQPYYQYDTITNAAALEHRGNKPRSESHSSWSHNPITKKKKLGVFPLAILTFYAVSGGPFGIEDIVRAGGPRFALIGFSLLLVWAVPESLITAELSTAFPGSSGSVAWVEAAFGPFWAFQKGWLSWLSGVSDNALYPILFYDCFMEFLDIFKSDSGSDRAGSDSTSNTTDSTSNSFTSTDDDAYSVYSNQTVRFLFLASLTALLTGLNLKGLDVVGNVALVICVISLLPFVVFCILGAPQVQPHRWTQALDGGMVAINWRLLFNTFFWNINFWESAACFSADVSEPEKTYPRGMAIAVALVFFSTFLPILIGIGISDAPYEDWTDGYFVHLGEVIGGSWLSRLMMLGAAIANIGMFEAEMSSDAWQLCGMAETGTLPKILATRNSSDVPYYSVLMSASGVILIVCMDFSDVIDMLNMLYCFGQLIEFAAFLYLRYAYPHLNRPYKIPLNLTFMTILLLFPTVFIFIIISFSSKICLILSFICAILGIFAYYLLKLAKKKKWAEFYDDVDDTTTNNNINNIGSIYSNNSNIVNGMSGMNNGNNKKGYSTIEENDGEGEDKADMKSDDTTPL